MKKVIPLRTPPKTKITIIIALRPFNYIKVIYTFPILIVLLLFTGQFPIVVVLAKFEEYAIGKNTENSLTIIVLTCSMTL